MDFGHASRLSADRRVLSQALADFDHSWGAEAESLRSTLTDALESLRRFYDDEEFWETARGVAGRRRKRDPLAVNVGYVDSLPPLLELFGYRTPPPPPAARLVSEAVTALRPTAEGESPADDVDDARRALGDLLERTLSLAEAKPWEVANRATEAEGFLEMGVSVAVGAGVGAIGAVVGGVTLGAVTGGVGIVAPILVLGGIKRWKTKRADRDRASRVTESRDRLPARPTSSSAGSSPTRLRR